MENSLRKSALFALAAVAFAAELAPAWSAPHRIRWDEAIDPQASRVLLYNLSANPAEATLGSRTVALSAQAAAEMPAAQPGRLEMSGDAALLILQADDRFDASSVEIDRTASGLRTVPDKLRRPAPAWAQELVAGVASIRHGATGSVEIRSENPAARVEVAVESLAPHTAVRIRQFDALGNEVTSLVAMASQRTRWRATLEPVGDGSRIELQTLRGEAQATAAPQAARKPERLPLAILQKAGGGLAKFEPTINWINSANLNYRVTGGPASLCGDLHISRNGSPYGVTPGWMCLDSSGNGSKGPWTYAGQAGDEDATAYMVWSDGSSTNSANHIWDKTRPIVSIGSNNAQPAPTSVSGTAYDGLYGSGFSAGFGAAAGGGRSTCDMYFHNTTTNRFWCPGSGYVGLNPCYVSCTISGMPSRSVTWSISSGLPPGFHHTLGQCYTWGVYIYDNSTLGQWGNNFFSFCVQ